MLPEPPLQAAAKKNVETIAQVEQQLLRQRSPMERIGEGRRSWRTLASGSNTAHPNQTGLNKSLCACLLFHRKPLTEITPDGCTDPGGRYRHYKGQEYTVIGVARHSETVAEMVVLG